MVTTLIAKVRKDLKESEITPIMLKTLSEYLTSKGIQLLTPPQFSDVSLDGENLTFKVKLHERPKFLLCPYINIPIKKKFPDLPLEDIDKIIQFDLDLHEKSGTKITEEELAKEKGHFSAKTYRTFIHELMLKDREKENRNDAIQQVRDYLVKHTRITLPKDLIDELTEVRYQQDVEKWVNDGHKKEDIPPNGKNLSRKNIEEELKFFTILDAIAEKEKLQGYPNTLEFILNEAEYN